MNMAQALQDLGVTSDTLPSQNRADLDDKGYTVFHGLIDGSWLAELRERFEQICTDEGAAAGIEVSQEAGARLLADLVNKGSVFDPIYTHPVVLAAAHHVIRRDMKLHSLNGRDALPGEGRQGLHADWSDADVPDGQAHVCNSIWLLDDFTRDNGCTRLVPGTHQERHPRNVLADVMAPHPEEEYLVAPAGSVAVFNGHTWHGGTRNQTRDRRRRGIFCAFIGREHPQQTDQRRYIRPDTWKRASRATRFILDVDLD